MSTRQINKVVLPLIGLVLWLTLVDSLAQAQDKSVLFAPYRVYGVDPPRFLVDPVLQEKLEADGWRVGYALLDRLDWQVLSKFNVLVLIQHPDVVAIRYEQFINEKHELLKKFLASGGGVLVFADENRGRTYPYWNELMQPFGITINTDSVAEKDSAKRQHLKAYHSQEAFLTTNILPSPITEGVNELWYPAGLTATFDAGGDWKIAVRASKTAHTVNTGETIAAKKTYEGGPPIMAYRQSGPGRIVVFSSHSSYYTLNPYHLMWDKGFFLNNGQGYRLLTNIYTWLAQPSVNSGRLGGFTKSEQKQLYDLAAQMKESSAQTVGWTIGGAAVRKALIGVQSSYSGGKHTVPEFADAAKRLGIDMLVFTEQADAMDKTNWQKLEADCKAVSTEKFLALPGVHFTGLEEKNEGVAFNLKKPWYDIPYAGTGFWTYIRIGVNTGWSSDVATVAPSANPISIYNMGAITGCTLFRYEGIKLVDSDVKTFLQTNAEGWGLFPMAYAAIDDPADLEKMRDAYFTYFYSNRWGTDYDPRENSLHESFVSNGPVIDYLKYEAPGPWIALDDRVVTVSFKAHSDVPIQKVTVMGNGKVLRTFRPTTDVVEESFRYRTNENIHFCIIVTDQNGHTAYSRTVTDSRLRYAYFIGGDRMNGYWEPVTSAEPEVAFESKLGGRYGRLGTSLFPGLGWGDHVSIRTGPQQNDHPLGLETGPPQGGLSGVELTPLIHMNGTAEFQESAPYRRVSLNSTDCIIMRDTIDKIRVWDKKSDRLRIATPPSEYLRGEVVATAFRCPNTFLMTIEAELEAKRDFDIDAGQPNYMFMIPYDGYADTYQSIVSKNGSQPVQVVDYAAPEKYELAEKSFIGLTDNTFGVGALFTFEPTDVNIRQTGQFPRLYAFPQLQNMHVRKGQKIHSKYLLVLTQGDEGNAADIFKTVYDKYGFDGTPASTITVQTGTLLSNILTPEFQAAEYGMRASFTQAELPTGLGIKVHGLHSNWDVSLYDVHAGQLVRNVAMDEGITYVNLDVSRKRDIFIGNLVRSNRDDIFINVYDASAKRLNFTVHNPTDKAITASITSAPDLGIPTVAEEITLLPGETKDYQRVH